MNQNQCVPSRGLEDDVTPVPTPVPVPPPPPSTFRSHPDISLQDYEVTELTWENGRLTMHGLGLPRVPNNTSLASGTLESVVNQATQNPPSGGGACKKHSYNDLVHLFNGRRYSDAPSVSISMDALVPTAPNNMVGCSTPVGSCSVAVARVPTGSDWSVSLSESERSTRQHFSGGVNGMTSTKTAVTGDDSVCYRGPQKGRSREVEDENKKKPSKRSRTAAIHNQSERKRRNKINERMKTLQKMVPNSSKTDKSSMLDEVIEYLKQLQAQVHMMSSMTMPSMMMTIPMAMQMSIMSQLGMMGIDHMNGATVTPPNNVVGISDPVGFPTHFVPNVAWDGVSCAPSVGHRISSYNPTMVQSDPLATYLACQQNQPMTMGAYSRMTAIYQQLHQQLGHTSDYPV